MATNRPSRLKNIVTAYGCALIVVTALLTARPLYSDDTLDDVVVVPLITAWIVDGTPLPGSDVAFTDADAVTAATAILLSTSLHVDPGTIIGDPRIKHAVDGEVEAILRSGDYPEGTFIITLQQDMASENENAFLVNATSGPLGRTVYRIVFSGNDDDITTQVDILGMS